MHIYKIFLILSFLLITSNCEKKIYYSGKIYNQNINFTDFKNKDDILLNLGKPNFIDIIDNKYYYFNEKILEKNAFKKEVKDRYIIVYTFNNDNVVDIETYDLNNENKIKNIKQTTQNNIIEKGLIEKIFGGVSTAPNTSQ